MNILVTGGRGFVGANLAAALARCSSGQVFAADVAPVDDCVTDFFAQAGVQVEQITLDVRDRDGYAQVVAQAEITHILHCAALTPSPEQEQADPETILDVNLAGAVNALLAGARGQTVERVLLCSSSGVYGASGGQAFIDENAPLALDNFYAITKVSAELLAAHLSELCGKPMASVRLGSVYGPFEQPRPSRGHISQVQRMLNALRAGQALRLYGPQVTRDWVYTADVSEAMRALLVAPRWRYPVYNIGSGRAVSLEQMAAVLEARGLRTTWVDRPEEADIAMTAENSRAVLDLSRLSDDTGFTPRYDFAAGIAELFKDGSVC